MSSRKAAHVGKISVKIGTYSTANSSLYWKVYKVYHISEGKNYIKLKALFYYKSSGEPCLWMNPEGQPKNIKLILSVVRGWTQWD